MHYGQYLNSKEDLMHQQFEDVFSRRRFLQGAAMLGLAGLAGGALASCGTSGSSSSITFWNLFGGGDGARMIEMEQAFQQQNPSSDVKAVTAKRRHRSPVAPSHLCRRQYPGADRSPVSGAIWRYRERFPPGCLAACAIQRQALRHTARHASIRHVLQRRCVPQSWSAR